MFLGEDEYNEQDDTLRRMKVVYTAVAVVLVVLLAASYFS